MIKKRDSLQYQLKAYTLGNDNKSHRIRIIKIC